MNISYEPSCYYQPSNITLYDVLEYCYQQMSSQQYQQDKLRILDSISLNNTNNNDNDSLVDLLSTTPYCDIYVLIMKTFQEYEHLLTTTNRNNVSTNKNEDVDTTISNWHNLYCVIDYFPTYPPPIVKTPSSGEEASLISNQQSQILSSQSPLFLSQVYIDFLSHIENQKYYPIALEYHCASSSLLQCNGEISKENQSTEIICPTTKTTTTNVILNPHHTQLITLLCTLGLKCYDIDQKKWFTYQIAYPYIPVEFYTINQNHNSSNYTPISIVNTDPQHPNNNDMLHHTTKQGCWKIPPFILFNNQNGTLPAHNNSTLSITFGQYTFPPDYPPESTKQSQSDIISQSTTLLLDFELNNNGTNSIDYAYSQNLSPLIYHLLFRTELRGQLNSVQHHKTNNTTAFQQSNNNNNTTTTTTTTNNNNNNKQWVIKLFKIIPFINQFIHNFFIFYDGYYINRSKFDIYQQKNDNQQKQQGNVEFDDFQKIQTFLEIFCSNTNNITTRDILIANSSQTTTNDFYDSFSFKSFYFTILSAFIGFCDFLLFSPHYNTITTSDIVPTTTNALSPQSYLYQPNSPRAQFYGEMKNDLLSYLFSIQDVVDFLIDPVFAHLADDTYASPQHDTIYYEKLNYVDNILQTLVTKQKITPQLRPASKMNAISERELIYGSGISAFYKAAADCTTLLMVVKGLEKIANCHLQHYPSHHIAVTLPYLTNTLLVYKNFLCTSAEALYIERLNAQSSNTESWIGYFASFFW